MRTPGSDLKYMLSLSGLVPTILVGAEKINFGHESEGSNFGAAQILAIIVHFREFAYLIWGFNCGTTIIIEGGIISCLQINLTTLVYGIYPYTSLMS